MKSKKLKPKYYSAEQLKLRYTLIDQAAIEVVKKLTIAGFKAYLVGGCIRDLLLGITPKDFDVSTDAIPAQIRRVFPRSRVIGQRFKIVHVTIKRELFEISTFRQAVRDHHKDKATGQVLDDNVFGTIEDDVSRRDFTVNALYYDVESKQVIDYFNGIRHIREKKLELIGDPDTRLAEDPGRILRTVRFQSKFGFKVSSEIVEAIYRNKYSLNNIPPARRFDEVLKLFYCGKATRMWELLNEYDLLPYLFTHSDDNKSPQAKLSKSITAAALINTDQRITQEKPVISAFMFCAILWPYYHHRFKYLVNKKYDPQEAMVQASEEIISQQLLRTGMLRRVSNTIRDIWWLQYRLEKARKKQVVKILSHPRFRAGYDFLLIRVAVGDVDAEIAEFWTLKQEEKKVSIKKKPIKKSRKSKKGHWRKAHGHAQR